MARTGMSKGRPNFVAQYTNGDSRIIPSIPSDLKVEGANFWTHTFSNAHWLDSEADKYVVYLASKVVDDISVARQEIDKTGRYQVLPNGLSARSAASIDLEHLQVSLNSYLAAIGLTPTDRVKMGIAPKQEKDVLEELSRRRYERAITQNQNN